MRLPLFAVAALSLSSLAAHASQINGSIEITGNDTYSSTSINFNPSTGAVIAAYGDASPFAPVVNMSGTTTNYVAALTSFAFTEANTPPGVTVFNVGNGTEALSFTLTSLQSFIGPMGSLTLNGNGYFTETGYSQTAGTFVLTSATIGSTSFDLTASTSGFVAPTAVTPEPSTFALLGTGLASLVGFARRRLV